MTPAYETNGKLTEDLLKELSSTHKERYSSVGGQRIIKNQNRPSSDFDL